MWGRYYIEVVRDALLQGGGWPAVWREDHLFSLQQALKMYDAVQQRIAAYEQEILGKLGEVEREQLMNQRRRLSRMPARPGRSRNAGRRRSGRPYTG
jgi:hypothetical protein